MAASDSVDTRSVLDALRDLVSQCNVYIDNQRKHGTHGNRLLLKNVATYVTSILRMFGAIEGEEAIGFPMPGSQNNLDLEKTVTPYLAAFASFRENVRQIARAQKAHEILKLCDEVRDEVLPNLGVRLEDHDGQDAVIKLVDRETLMKEREDRLKAEEQKKLEKQKIVAEKEAQRKIAPCDMFRNETDKYSKFDDKGMPTHDAAGNEMSKSALKKLAKLYEAQEKRYNEHLKSRTDARQDQLSQ